jgi:hypothetical protein
MVCILSLAI